jgi:putative spermidine/putrescine transport system permease protein
MSAAFQMPALALLGVAFLFPIWEVIRQNFQNAGGAFTLAGYRALYTSPLVGKVLLNTIGVSLLTTGVTLVLAYPVAYHLSRQGARRRALLMILVLLPFWTSILVKSFAFEVILGGSSIIAQLLMAVTGTSNAAASPFLFNRVGVVIGLTQFLIPFMVFPILANLRAQDPDIARAAQIMGAAPTRIFWQVTFPLSAPAVTAGVLLVFTLSFGSFITPALLGGAKDLMIGNLISFYIHDVLDWTLASAISILLLALSAGIGLIMVLLPSGTLSNQPSRRKKSG